MTTPIATALRTLHRSGGFVSLVKADTPEEATKRGRGPSGRTHQIQTAFVLVAERDGGAQA